MVLLQVLNVPWPGEPLFVYVFQVITALPRVMDDLIRSFPIGAKLSLGRIFCCCGNLAQDEVTYVKSSEFHPPIEVLGHLLLVPRHSAKSLVSYFI